MRERTCIDTPCVPFLLFVFVGLIFLQGCKTTNPDSDEQPSASPAPTGASYQLRGIVVASDAAKGVVTVDTEAIPGLMGAMTMPYKLEQPGSCHRAASGRSHCRQAAHLNFR